MAALILTVGLVAVCAIIVVIICAVAGDAAVQPPTDDEVKAVYHSRLRFYY